MYVETFHWGLALGALLLTGAAIWLAFRVRRRLGRRSRVRRAARALRAERLAAGVLEACGYEVIGRQVRQSWGLCADDEDVKFTLIADYLVERRGQRWVAEVKTGDRALDLRYGPTRRQLLEYREAFAVDGVLLVDAERQTVRSVRFRHRPKRWATAAIQFGAGLLVGLVLGGVLALLRDGHGAP